MASTNGTISRGGGAAAFSHYRDMVASEAAAGFTLCEIEDFIAACAIDEEQKSALWLWAWLHQPPRVVHTFEDSELLSSIQAETDGVPRSG